MSTSEGSLSQDLRPHLLRVMPGSVVLKHADKFRTGVPDHSVTWRWLTSWWEVKFWDNGDFAAPKLQRIMCTRLARAGLCAYIIYAQDGADRTVRIVAPTLLDHWRRCTYYAGFDHEQVARHIRRQHERVLRQIRGG